MRRNLLKGGVEHTVVSPAHPPGRPTRRAVLTRRTLLLVPLAAALVPLGLVRTFRRPAAPSLSPPVVETVRTNSPPSPQEYASPIGLLAYTAGEDPPGSQEQVLIDIFKQHYPRVDVTFEHYGWPRYGDVLRSLSAANTVPDVFAFADLRDGARVALTDLAPYVKLDQAAYQSEDWFDYAEKSTWWQGKKYGVSRGCSVQLLFWNQDIFAANAVPPPARDWTWQGDWLPAMRRLTVDASGRTALDAGFAPAKATQWGCQGGPWKHSHMGAWAPYMYAWGGTWFDDDLEPSRWNLLGAQARTGLEFYFDLITRQGLFPSERRAAMAATDADVVDKEFGAGRAATVNLWSEVIPALKDSPFPWGVQLLPHGPVVRAQMGTNVMYHIGASSKQKDHAWELLKTFATREGQLARVRAGMALAPPRRSVATSGEWLAQYPNVKREDAVSIAQSLDELIPWPGSYIRDFLLPFGTVGEIEDAFEGIVGGRRTVKQALDDLRPRLEGGLAGARTGR